MYTLLFIVMVVVVVYWFIDNAKKAGEQCYNEKQWNYDLFSKDNELAVRQTYHRLRLLNLNGPLECRGINAAIAAGHIYSLYNENPIRFIRFMELYEADKANKHSKTENPVCPKCHPSSLEDEFSDDLLNSIIVDLQNKIIKSNFQGVVFDPEHLYLVVKDYHKLKQSDIPA